MPWHGVTAQPPCQLLEKSRGDLQVTWEGCCQSFSSLKQTPPAGWVPGTQVFPRIPCSLVVLYSFPASYHELNYREKMEPQVRAAGTSSNNVAIWGFIVLGTSTLC